MASDLSAICGDAVAELKKLPSESVQLIVTDPPYNLGKDYGTTDDNLEFDEYLEFSRKWLSEAHRVLTKNGSIYVFMGVRFIAYIYAILERELGMHLNSWITWSYTQGIGKKRGFSPRHDDILLFTKDPKDFVFNLDEVRVPQKAYRSINNMRGANPGNVWEFSHVHYCHKNRRPHPTQKPEALYLRMILASSHQGDTVVDPFLGSGTLLRVCQQTSRKGIGIDCNSDYINMAKERLAVPFSGFDSIDARLLRVPTDLNDHNLCMSYVRDHIDWFLAYYPKAVPDFIAEVKRQYSKKLSHSELAALDDLTKRDSKSNEAPLFGLSGLMAG